MLDILQKLGVEQIKTVGEAVNVDLHEVVGMEKNHDGATGIIVKEIQRGYTMRGKVLRVAKVIVSE